LSDLEKAFAYLTGGMSETIWATDIERKITHAINSCYYKNIEFTYFFYDFYKKGTVHIKYKYPELIDCLNIYAARHRNWLPPNYGRVKYSDMTDDEQAVVNEFHFDPETDKLLNPKKSAERYAKILERSGFYLTEPTQSLTLIGDNSIDLGE
jgi:hypothetical protein